MLRIFERVILLFAGFMIGYTWRNGPPEGAVFWYFIIGWFAVIIASSLIYRKNIMDDGDE
jgi:hypothetical protein